MCPVATKRTRKVKIKIFVMKPLFKEPDDRKQVKQWYAGMDGEIVEVFSEVEMYNGWPMYRTMDGKLIDTGDGWEQWDYKLMDFEGNTYKVPEFVVTFRFCNYRQQVVGFDRTPLLNEKMDCYFLPWGRYVVCANGPYVEPKPKKRRRKCSEQSVS